MAKVEHFVFVDESGDPGVAFTIDAISGIKAATGASTFYIIAALCVPVDKLPLLQHRMAELKAAAGYKKEIKSSDISLRLYAALLDLINELDLKVYYRLIDKSTYQGTYKVDGKPLLHNVFDEFNVARAVAFAIMHCGLHDVEVVIDRADRRLFDGKFDTFNAYLEKKVLKYMEVAGQVGPSHIGHVTHVNSEYVYAMQMSDLIGGAIRDDFTEKNKDLLKVIAPERLIKATSKYEPRKRAKKRPSTP